MPQPCWGGQTGTCQICQQSQADVARQHFGRRVGHWQQDDITSRKQPAAVLEDRFDLSIVSSHFDLRMRGRQQNMMIQLLHDLAPAHRAAR